MIAETAAAVVAFAAEKLLLAVPQAHCRRHHRRTVVCWASEARV